MKHPCPHCGLLVIELTPEQLAMPQFTCQCPNCQAKSYYRICPKCKKAYFFRAPAQTCPKC